MKNHDLKFLIKRFSLIFFPLVFLTTFLHFSYLSKEDNNRFQHIAEKEKASIDYFSDLIAKDFTDVRLQLLSLSELPCLSEYVNNPSESTRQSIATYFQKIASLRKKYGQIRYIDKSGFEQVRVNYKNGEAMIVSADLFQDKSERYYTVETLKLKEGELFISPLDLNKENGQLEYPLKPVIRFATPILNSNGDTEGIIVLNYLADNLYNTFFAHYSEERFGHPFVLDSQGNTLFSQESSLGESLYKIQNLQPTENTDKTKQLKVAMEQLRALGDLSNQIDKGQGFYLLDSLFNEKISLHDSRNRDFVSSLKEGLGWQVGLIANQEDLYEETFRASENGMSLILLYWILIALIAFILAKFGLQQKHIQMERLRVESERKEEFAALIESVPSGILVCNESGEIAKVNKGIEELFGYSRDELIGQLIEKLVPSQFQDKHADQRHAFMKETDKTNILNPWDGWLVGQNKNGENVPVSISVKKLHTSSGLTTVASVFDMTEQKTHQEALNLAVEEANKANQAKSLFLSTMSHEIRTPLNAIIGMLYLHTTSGLTKQQLAQVNVMKIASDKLLTIINDILDFSKIEAGEMVLESTTFRLKSVLDEMQKIFSLQAETNNNTLDIDSLASLDIPALIGDRTRLGQILINLLSNACKFTKDGKVKLRVTEVGPRTDKRIRLRFDVIDTGIGMSEENKSKIFDSFAQSDHSITRKYGGSGLGLSIVKKLIDIFEGEISVTSELELGTKFSVEIPFEYSPESLSQELDFETNIPLRILIADDQETDRMVLLKKAQQLGWSAEAFSDGKLLIEKAVQYLQKGNPIDCIIVDWKMPSLDGIETIEALSQRIGANDMPSIIMVTADQKSNLLKSIDNIKPDSILTKPVQASSLFNSVNEAVVKHGLDPENIVNKTKLLTSGERWLNGMHILVVDDSEMNLLVCKDILLNQGAEVTISESGASAIERLKEDKYKFDAILMDIQMPHMNGLEATQIIRQELNLLLPIIALSAGVTYEERINVSAAGMDAFLSKPMEPELMIKTLAHLISSYRHASLAPTTEKSQKKLEVLTAENWPMIEGVDHEHAQRLATGNFAFYQSMLSLFIKEQAQIVDELAPLIQAQDFEAVRAKIHKFNGQAGNLGLTKLHGMGTEMEQAAMNAALQEVETAYEALKERFDNVLQTLREVID